MVRAEDPFGPGLIACSAACAHCAKESGSPAGFIMEENLEPRDPESSDLLKICASLNKAGARYIVIGGMAMVLHGFNRNAIA